jgi:hypothetical protein
MNLNVWPYFKYEGKWSIPHEMMIYTWNEMIKREYEKIVFYDGYIKSAEDFIFFMQDKNQAFSLSVDLDSKKILAWGMINGLKDGVAYAHFSFLNGFKRGPGETVIDSWRNLKGENGENLVNVLIGITPESYNPVLKIIQSWGFQIIGKIPKICNLHYENRKESGVISYLDLKEE